MFLPIFVEYRRTIYIYIAKCVQSSSAPLYDKPSNRRPAYSSARRPKIRPREKYARACLNKAAHSRVFLLITPHSQPINIYIHMHTHACMMHIVYTSIYMHVGWVTTRHTDICIYSSTVYMFILRLFLMVKCAYCVRTLVCISLCHMYTAAHTTHISFCWGILICSLPKHAPTNQPTKKTNRSNMMGCDQKSAHTLHIFAHCEQARAQDWRRTATTTILMIKSIKFIPRAEREYIFSLHLVARPSYMYIYTLSIAVAWAHSRFVFGGCVRV